MSGRGYDIEQLTINVCTVDRPDYLDGCLRSLLDTTPEGAPLNIVFNGTPDETRQRTIALAESWPGPTKFHHIADLVPLDESHNQALDLVETPLVNFMGDDDVVLRPRLHLLLDAFNDLAPEPAAVTTYARRVAGDPRHPKQGSVKSLGPTSIEEWEQWRDDGTIFEMLWPGAVFRTELVREIGGFEARFNQSADNRIFTQLARLAPVLSLTDDGFGYRVHSGSLSTGNWKVQNQHVRYVRACHEATRRGDGEPTFDEFLADERAMPWLERQRMALHDHSRMRFRRGGELYLQGDYLGGVTNLAASVALWPPAFVGKVIDQLGH